MCLDHDVQNITVIFLPEESELYERSGYCRQFTELYKLITIPYSGGCIQFITNNCNVYKKDDRLITYSASGQTINSNFEVRNKTPIMSYEIYSISKENL